MILGFPCFSCVFLGFPCPFKALVSYRLEEFKTLYFGISLGIFVFFDLFGFVLDLFGNLWEMFGNVWDNFRTFGGCFGTIFGHVWQTMRKIKNIR